MKLFDPRCRNTEICPPWKSCLECEWRVCVSSTDALIFDPFYHVTQHERKICPVSKNHTCLTSCQTTSDAPIGGDVIVGFCTQSMSSISHETTPPNSEHNLLWFKTWAGGFFIPKRNMRVKLYRLISLACLGFSCWLALPYSHVGYSF